MSWSLRRTKKGWDMSFKRVFDKINIAIVSNLERYTLTCSQKWNFNKKKQKKEKKNLSTLRHIIIKSLKTLREKLVNRHKISHQKTQRTGRHDIIFGVVLKKQWNLRWRIIEVKTKNIIKEEILEHYQVWNYNRVKLWIHRDFFLDFSKLHSTFEENL